MSKIELLSDERVTLFGLVIGEQKEINSLMKSELIDDEFKELYLAPKQEILNRLVNKLR